MVLPLSYSKTLFKKNCKLIWTHKKCKHNYHRNYCMLCNICVFGVYLQEAQPSGLKSSWLKPAFEYLMICFSNMFYCSVKWVVVILCVFTFFIFLFFIFSHLKQIKWCTFDKYVISEMDFKCTTELLEYWICIKMWFFTHILIVSSLSQCRIYHSSASQFPSFILFHFDCGGMPAV